MLRWRQIQAIIDRLSGQEHVSLRAHDLDEPFRTIYGRVAPAGDRPSAEMALWRATEGMEGRERLFQELAVLIPGEGTLRQFPSLEEMAGDLPPVEWLWPGWIPRGMLSLLGAAPGAGKSLVALDLARRLIHGPSFPDGAEVPAPGGNVVYVDAEAAPQLQNERAQAWGMDRSRLYLMLPPEAYGMIDFAAESCQNTLVQMCYELSPHLVIVDSLGAISVRGENNVEDVRAMLGFLGSVAREFDLGLLLVHHLRKRGKLLAALGTVGPVGSEDFRGSGHIIAMARSVLALSALQPGPEGDRNGPRRLEVIKTNLCRYPEALGVYFEESEGATGLDGAPVLRYSEAPKASREPTRAEECARWLVEVLEQAGGPVRPKEVLRQAEEAGYSEGVVYRARKALEATVVDTLGRHAPGNRWGLAGSVG